MTTDDFITEKEYIIRRVLHIHFMPNHICSKYRIELDDLMQVGRLALWEASKKFQPKEGGTSFDTYAHRMVKFKLLEYLRYLRRPIRHSDYSLSIDAEVIEGIDLLDVIPSEENIEERVLDSFYIESLSEKFTVHEKNVFQLKLMGFTYIDIERMMSVKGKKFRDIKFNVLEKLKNDRLQTAAE